MSQHGEVTRHGLKAKGVNLIEPAARRVRISKCRRCTFVISGSPATVSLQGLKSCRVLILDCPGEVEIRDCTDCILSVGAAQVAVHSSASLVLCLDVWSPTHVGSNCAGVVLAPWNVQIRTGGPPRRDIRGVRWQDVKIMRAGHSSAAGAGQAPYSLIDLHPETGWQAVPDHGKTQALPPVARLAVASLLDQFDSRSLDGGWDWTELNGYGAAVGDHTKVKSDVELAWTLEPHGVSMIDVQPDDTELAQTATGNDSALDVSHGPRAASTPMPRLGLDGLLHLYGLQGVGALVRDIEAAGLTKIMGPGSLPPWRVDLGALRAAMHARGQSAIRAEAPVWSSAFDMTGRRDADAQADGGNDEAGLRDSAAAATRPATEATASRSPGRGRSRSPARPITGSAVQDSQHVGASASPAHHVDQTAHWQESPLPEPVHYPRTQPEPHGTGLAEATSMREAARKQVQQLSSEYAKDKAQAIEDGSVELLVELLLIELSTVCTAQPPHAYMQLREEMRGLAGRLRPKSSTGRASSKDGHGSPVKGSGAGAVPTDADVVSPRSVDPLAITAAQLQVLLASVGIDWPLPVVAVVAVKLGGKIRMATPPSSPGAGNEHEQSAANAAAAGTAAEAPTSEPIPKPANEPQFDQVRLPLQVLEDALSSMRHANSPAKAGSRAGGRSPRSPRANGMTGSSAGSSPRAGQAKEARAMDMLVAALCDATVIPSVPTRDNFPTWLTDSELLSLLSQTSVIPDVWAACEAKAAARAWLSSKVGTAALYAEEARLVQELAHTHGVDPGSLMTGDRVLGKGLRTGKPHPAITDRASQQLMAAREEAYIQALAGSPEVELQILQQYVKDTRFKRWPVAVVSFEVLGLQPQELQQRLPQTEASESYPNGFEAWLRWRQACRLAKELGVRMAVSRRGVFSPVKSGRQAGPEPTPGHDGHSPTGRYGETSATFADGIDARSTMFNGFTATGGQWHAHSSAVRSQSAPGRSPDAVGMSSSGVAEYQPALSASGALSPGGGQWTRAYQRTGQGHTDFVDQWREQFGQVAQDAGPARGRPTGRDGHGHQRSGAGRPATASQSYSAPPPFEPMAAARRRVVARLQSPSRRGQDMRNALQETVHAMVTADAHDHDVGSGAYAAMSQGPEDVPDDVIARAVQLLIVHEADVIMADGHREAEAILGRDAVGGDGGYADGQRGRDPRSHHHRPSDSTGRAPSLPATRDTSPAGSARAGGRHSEGARSVDGDVPVEYSGALPEGGVTSPGWPGHRAASSRGRTMEAPLSPAEEQAHLQLSRLAGLVERAEAAVAQLEARAGGAVSGSSPSMPLGSPESSYAGVPSPLMARLQELPLAMATMQSAAQAHGLHRPGEEPRQQSWGTQARRYGQDDLRPTGPGIDAATSTSPDGRVRVSVGYEQASPEGQVEDDSHYAQEEQEDAEYEAGGEYYGSDGQGQGNTSLSGHPINQLSQSGGQSGAGSGQAGRGRPIDLEFEQRGDTQGIKPTKVHINPFQPLQPPSWRPFTSQQVEDLIRLRGDQNDEDRGGAHGGLDRRASHGGRSASASRSPGKQQMWMPVGTIHRRRMSGAHALDPARLGTCKFEDPSRVYGPPKPKPPTVTKYAAKLSASGRHVKGSASAVHGGDAGEATGHLAQADHSRVHLDHYDAQDQEEWTLAAVDDSKLYMRSR